MEYPPEILPSNSPMTKSLSLKTTRNILNSFINSVDKGNDISSEAEPMPNTLTEDSDDCEYENEGFENFEDSSNWGFGVGGSVNISLEAPMEVIEQLKRVRKALETKERKIVSPVSDSNIQTRQPLTNERANGISDHNQVASKVNKKEQKRKRKSEKKEKRKNKEMKKEGNG
mmetsp:Transcript_34465/g.67796  ORF Transcript_34465/g.67796 Transcript_34465/m.67796 type:complete len:172 (+) Transcript_34465:166-681(+)|eukprot:CAMPEP_0194325730 /NCGR_PEP_ID=MMETSP0171-20130528/32540_1 /TAXON_ID=218684 /ORGANISM="Corethron pennatum, Strain L29A3" /LENGTH=171 /DNA_ID=CAMNT_0039085003 /DNA_START=39 /DNA_END=554 /DNA_ORIENTATION=+